jgi:RNA polymerase sigma factor (TIGR02999 family)
MARAGRRSFMGNSPRRWHASCLYSVKSHLFVSSTSMPDQAPDPQHVTEWLAAWRTGDVDARNQLFAVVYPQLRQIAGRVLRHERADHTLDPTALVNELALRLLGSAPISYNDRSHFFALAAQMMRRILVDYARARVAGKRGGVQQRVTLSSVGEDLRAAPQSEDLLLLDDAMSRLERADPRAAKVVELRFFGGLHEQEVAEILGVSVITVKRDWKVARAWLIDQLQFPR